MISTVMVIRRVGAVLHKRGNAGLNTGGSNLNDPGAAYTFIRDSGGEWSQQASIRASNSGSTDLFGSSVSLSDDATTLAIGADGEKSNASGVNGELPAMPVLLIFISSLPSEPQALTA